MDMRGNITDNTTNTTPKTLITQFQILYKELSNYSPKLAAKPYAIAITKADISNKDMQSFGKFKLDSNFKDAKIYLSPTLHDFITHGITQPPPTQSKPTSNTSPLQSQVSNVKNSQNLDSIESKISSHDEPLESKASNIEKTQNLDSKTPLFIIQISSIAHKNLDALKSLLLSALKLQK